jgi:hypothetical protein
MERVVDGAREGVSEDGRRVIERNAMALHVPRRFGGVPLKSPADDTWGEDVSRSTGCAESA